MRWPGSGDWSSGCQGTSRLGGPSSQLTWSALLCLLAFSFVPVLPAQAPVLRSGQPSFCISFVSQGKKKSSL